MKFVLLTHDFFENNKHLKEIEKKEDRPYLVFVVNIGNLKFAISIRSRIKHKHFFSSLGLSNQEIDNNIKSRNGNRGLDYSKAILITDDNYIRTDTGVVYISEEEFNYLKGKEYQVKFGMETYISKYIKAYSKQHIKSNKYLCELSTLQNYHNEIGLIAK